MSDDTDKLAKLEQTRARLDAALPFGLKPAELEFALRYLDCGNATEAAREPGKSDSAAGTRGVRMIRKPQVAAFVRGQLEKAIEDKWNGERMHVPEILARLARVGRFDIRKLFNADGSYKKISDLDEATVAGIRGWEDELSFDADGAPPTMVRKIKVADPVPALRTLAQINQLLSPDVHQVNIFLDLDARLEQADKRHQAAQKKLDNKVVSEQ